MGSLGVYSNRSAGLASRALVRSSQSLARSLQRLATGQRINAARDDAAGAAIAGRLESQVRGLGIAARNAADATSTIDTAEAALSGTNQALQRMRELAVASATGTYTDADRATIQLEFLELQAEIDRIARTEINGRALLDGTFLATFHIGPGANQTTSVYIASAKTTDIGEPAQPVTATVTSGPVTSNTLADGDVQLNGTDIRATAAGDDTVSFKDQKASAIAKAAAINDTSVTHGATATVNDNVVTGAGAVGAGTFKSNDLKIENVNIGEVTVLAGDSDSALRTAINAQSGATGVVATIDGSGRLVLTAADGRNINLDVKGDAVAITQHASGNNFSTITLTREGNLVIGGTAPGNAGLAPGTTIATGALPRTVADARVTTQSEANIAIEILDGAIDAVSAERAELGALHERLERTIEGQLGAQIDLASAESRIASADYGAELLAKAREDLRILSAAEVLTMAVDDARRLSRAAIALLVG